MTEQGERAKFFINSTQTFPREISRSGFTRAITRQNPTKGPTKKDIIKGIGALLKNRNLKADLGSNSINVGFCPPNDGIKPDLLAAAGVVVDVKLGSRGKNGIDGYVKIRHADGSHTVYVHVRPCVRVTESVAEGQEIAVSDVSGRATGPHLHFGYQPPNTPRKTRSDPMEILPQLNPRGHPIRPRIWMLN